MVLNHLYVFIDLLSSPLFLDFVMFRGKRTHYLRYEYVTKKNLEGFLYDRAG